MTMRQGARGWLVVLLMCLLTPVGVSAQQATAELNGRVTDTSGAVLPGVTVTATQTDDRAHAHRCDGRDLART